MRRLLLLAVSSSLVAMGNSASAIDLTNPRSEAEYLALEIAGTLRPQTALADQIQLDLSTIRSSYPTFADIHVFPTWLPGDVLVDMTRDSFESLKAGTYTGFDELFAELGTPQMQLHGDHPLLTPGVYLQFNALYHGVKLAEMFADSPGVVDTWPNQLIGDGDDIVAWSNRTYTLSRGSGDCPAGCIYRESWSFVVTGGGGGALVATPVPEPSTTCFVWLLAAVGMLRCRR